MKNLELIEKLSNLNKVLLEIEDEYGVIGWGDYSIHIYKLSNLLKISDEDIKIVDRESDEYPYEFILKIDDIVYSCLGDESTIEEYTKYMEFKGDL